MGLIAVSITGTIDQVNAPFGLTPRKEIFTIKKSETEKLEELLAKLQVEAPEELNVDVANGVSADALSNKQVPVSLDKETESVSVETKKEEEVAKSETIEPAAKQADTSPPKKLEVPNIFTKKANEGQEIPVLPKIETQAEVDTNKVELPTKQDNKPTLKNVEEPIATKQDKIDDSNKISSVAKQPELPPVIQSEPPLQEKAKTVAPTVATESRKPDPIQAQESKESNKLVEVPAAATVEKDDKATLVKEEPTITKNQVEKPQKETMDVSTSTTKLEAKLQNQKENAESLVDLSNENKVSSGTESPTTAAGTSESSALKPISDAVEIVAQKNDETPSDKPKATTSLVAPAVSSVPAVGSVSKAASDVTGFVSKSLDNLKVPAASSSGASSASKAIESLNIPDPSSLKDSFSTKLLENQKVPGASGDTAPTSKAIESLNIPDTSSLKNSISNVLENQKVPGASGGAASASKAIESLNIPDPSSLKDSVSKVLENQQIPDASDLADVVAKLFANFKFPDTSALRDTVSKVLEELPRNPAALAALGTVLSATIISSVLGMMKGSSNPDTKSDNKSSAAPNGARTSDDRDVAIPKRQVSEGKSAPKNSLTPLEKKFTSEPLPNNGHESPTGKDSRSHAKKGHSTRRHTHNPPSTKSSSPPILKTPSDPSDRTAGTYTTKSMTPLEKKFGSAATSKNHSETSKAVVEHKRHGQAEAKSAPSNSVTSPGQTKSKTPLEKNFVSQDEANNNGFRNGSTHSTPSNEKSATNTPTKSTGVKSKTPLEQKFERDAAKSKNGATNPGDESAKTTANPKRDMADRAVKAKPMSEDPSKPPLKGKATITQSKRKYIMDADFEPAPSNGSNKSDTTSDKSSQALTNTPIVLDAVMNDAKGYATKVSGKENDSTSSVDSSVVLDDALMDSIKEYVKQQAGSSASPVSVDALMESVREYVQKQAGTKAPIVLDDALMDSIKEYVNKQAGCISDSSTSTK